MDQLSRPYQMALVGILVFAGGWFAFLRPKPSSDLGSPAATPVAATTSSSGPTAPGVKGLTRAITKAKAASATSDAANARIQEASGGATTAVSAAHATSSAATSSATTTPSKAATTIAASRAATTTPPKAATATVAGAATPILAALRHGKVVVLLFYGHGADDDAVRHALKGVDRHGRHVIVRSAPIGRLSDYKAITAGAEVGQSPTVLVIGPKKTARTIVGFTDSAVINQVVGDLRAGR